MTTIITLSLRCRITALFCTMRKVVVILAVFGGMAVVGSMAAIFGETPCASYLGLLAVVMLLFALVGVGGSNFG